MLWCVELPVRLQLKNEPQTIRREGQLKQLRLIRIVCALHISVDSEFVRRIKESLTPSFLWVGKRSETPEWPFKFLSLDVYKNINMNHQTNRAAFSLIISDTYFLKPQMANSEVSNDFNSFLFQLCDQELVKYFSQLLISKPIAKVAAV